MRRDLVYTILIAGASLTACNRQSSSDAVSNDPFAATSVRQEDRFGSGFGEAFRASRDSKPKTIDEGAVKPVSLTAQPLQVD